MYLFLEKILLSNNYLHSQNDNNYSFLFLLDFIVEFAIRTYLDLQLWTHKKIFGQINRQNNASVIRTTLKRRSIYGTD